MNKSYKNPEVSDDERRTYIRQRIKEETQKAIKLWENTGWGNRDRRARMYLQTIRPIDCITYRILAFVVYHDDKRVTDLDPYPEWHSLEWYKLQDVLKERLPGLINRLRNAPKRFLSLPLELADDPRTGDRNEIIINAKTHERKEDARALEDWFAEQNKAANKKKNIAKQMLTIGRMEPKKRRLELRRYIDDYF
jgi:hypothetical protein